MHSFRRSVVGTREPNEAPTLPGDVWLPNRNAAVVAKIAAMLAPSRRGRAPPRAHRAQHAGATLAMLASAEEILAVSSLDQGHFSPLLARIPSAGTAKSRAATKSEYISFNRLTQRRACAYCMWQITNRRFQEFTYSAFHRHKPIVAHAGLEPTCMMAVTAIRRNARYA